MTKKSSIVAGVAGNGRTLTEAREDALKRIEQMLSGGYTPWLFATPQAIGLTWRDPLAGWQYAIIPREVANGADLRRLQSTVVSQRSLDDAWNGLRECMLQNFVFARGMTDEALAEAAALIPGEANLIDDLRRWADWQKCFKAWERLGYPNALCHSLTSQKGWPKPDEPLYRAPDQ